MAWRISLAVAVLLLPAFSFATEMGFPAQSLWLSDTKPAIGEKVRIHTVLYNGTEADISGTLTYLVDTKEHEAKSVSLKSGESIILSSTWTAAEGDHAFSARFAQSGVAAVQTSATVSIQVDAPPSQLQQTVTQARDVGTQIASTSLPIVSSVANTVFQATESLRNAGISYLENAAGTNNSPLAADSSANPTVLGTSTTTAQRTNVEGFTKNVAAAAASEGWLNKIRSTASVITLYVFKSLWLFYPLLVIFLLIIFRWLYKWVTRPRF